ncbi:malto-oligosyltrehalose trehalohydrolase [soil metagenome]
MIRQPSPLGATPLPDNRCRFTVWAPFCQRVEVHITGESERFVVLDRDKRGYHTGILDDVPAGTDYFYRLDGERDRPDPVSKHQPEGVHGPSRVVDPDAFDWTDAAWSGLPRKDLVFYELHTGTFTDEGTFDAVIPHLDGLHDLGITCIELMPVNQFPGERNWGYDGVQLFAVQHSYGGPDGLRRLVDACHERGMAIILDVVYNHLGPEGNYLGEFGPYFTGKYSTPWGPAVNYDDRDSDEVHRFFLENALHWIRDYHFDGFRLDAIHAIYDQRPQPFLRKLGQAVHELGGDLGRTVHVIAESNMNDPRVINPAQFGGLGLYAEWNDDFHHALHASLTGEDTGYYRDYGGFNDLVKAIQSGFVYTGQHMSLRGRGHGDFPRLYEGDNFVVFAQNHDQIGNRARGDRLSTMIPFEMQKAVVGLVILSPYLPLFFQGEEYGETRPFPYFVDHGDPDLIEAVREGRAREFRSFDWEGEILDPASPDTFQLARLNRDALDDPAHRAIYDVHRTLLRLRKTHPALADLDMQQMEISASEADRVLVIYRRHATGDVCCAFNFGRDPATVHLSLNAGRWIRAFDSSGTEWSGSGSDLPESVETNGEVEMTLPAMSCAVYILDIEP